MNTITCPHCHKSFEFDDVLKHQIEEDLLAGEKKKHEKELAEVRKEGAKEAEEELKLIKEEMALKDKRLEEARAAEIEVRKQKVILEDEKKAFELEKQRELDKERENISSKAAAEQSEKDKYKLAELEKKLADTTKALDELNKKASQGSQQLQGEVLELDIEKNLRSAFTIDDILPVGKGAQGADIIQRVKGQSGKFAGIILWEAKDAKWSPSWLPKLREDGRKADAFLTVLVAKNMPSELMPYKFTERVLVTSPSNVIPLAALLRRLVLQHALDKQTAANKDEKLEGLFQYIQSEAFRHRFEAFQEGINTMKNDLAAEKRSTERVWKRRDTQIQRLELNSARMYGELQGVMGESLPDIKSLSMPELSEDSNNGDGA